MYYKLKAPTTASLKLAVWEAITIGLDPEYDMKTLTFDLGTGSIEKVSRLRDKHKLSVLIESDYEPTGYVRS
jgi:hypothetical protein